MELNENIENGFSTTLLGMMYITVCYCFCNSNQFPIGSQVFGAIMFGALGVGNFITGK